MNTWVLAKDLESMSKSNDPALPGEVRSFAAEVHRRYQYPVDSQLYSFDRTFIAQLGVDEFMKETAGTGNMDSSYERLLDHLE